ncbi:MAG: hypothetical protein AAGI52_17650 [Bacteroidota bacterium]
MPALRTIATRLSSLPGLDPEACGEAFGCAMDDLGGVPHRYLATNPGHGLAQLELRVGTTGGIVVATVAPEQQEAWARESARLGRLVGVDVVSPPVPAASDGLPRWTERREIGGVVLKFGFEGERERPRLVPVSRSW